MSLIQLITGNKQKQLKALDYIASKLTDVTLAAAVGISINLKYTEIRRKN